MSKEYKLYHPAKDKEMYVAKYQLDACLSLGWVQYVDESREAKEYYVPNFLDAFADKMTFGLLPKIPFRKWLSIHPSYNDASWIDIPWGVMSFGKLPTITESANIMKLFLTGLSSVAKAALLLLLASPLAFGGAYLIVQVLLYSR